MDDPRWQRAMERLGLNHEPTFLRYAQPDDPATFLRVVEALRQRGVAIHIFANSVLLSSFEFNGQEAPDLYEAVMAAFGGENDQHKDLR